MRTGPPHIRGAEPPGLEGSTACATGYTPLTEQAREESIHKPVDPLAHVWFAGSRKGRADVAYALDVGTGNLFLSAPVPFRFSGIAVLVWVVVIVIGAALASLAPAFRASRLTVREALAHV
jgi:hypothetical protein